MKIAIWNTGHVIADTVALAIAEGLGKPITLISTWNNDKATEFDLNIGYGILRGMDKVAKCGKPFIHLDNGYFKPGHFDGYYRISLNGTQQTNLTGITPDCGRLKALQLDIKPWRGFAPHKPVLVCPPTEAVSEFFGLEDYQFNHTNAVIRNKGTTKPVNFHDYNYVSTFNSSMGWQALVAGIPCVADSRSIIGAFGHVDDFNRMELFGIMAALQLTLNEIREGKIWHLIDLLLTNQQTHSTCLSDGMTGKQSAAM